MDPPEDPNSYNWAHQLPPPSRPGSSISYNPYLPSDSSSPSHNHPYFPQYLYQSPHQSMATSNTNNNNPMTDRQRMVYDLTMQNRQNNPPPPPLPPPPQMMMNGGIHPRPYSGHPAPNPFHYPPSQYLPNQNNANNANIANNAATTNNLNLNLNDTAIPPLPPNASLTTKQEHARSLIQDYTADKKRIISCRQGTFNAIRDLQAEIEDLEKLQKGQEYLRYIYPLQAELGRVEHLHDMYGREWEVLEEKIEICWAEIAVPEGS
ncbi:MAG: hypothetical protein Q9219_003271 [cf. Caloplaca sp. 3 TL-2023]